ncbi:Formylglycine-generating sulfatase enzyme [Botrimarina colliarenosi]|uniref:Formylglycine-generating sulfatase enzyme n=1 Tax=Botrimarina colliarenosi TaxID=2528001 RepID=A0A5C6AFG6_9BACT|nr:SUMF1/EgtB/PvdO family nonheme iron enzyme [Botrimarina colliarenosi]TWT98058.1 Formylglycine-generating sulfatase enzyme [Botrimarina colliarenosi]
MTNRFCYRLVASLALVLAAAGQGRGDAGLVAERPADDVRAVPTDRGWMVAYTETIPGTEVEFEMLPIPGGVVRLPVGPDDGDAAFVEVELPPYWVGKTEVTWAEYRRYMALDKAFALLQQLATLHGQGEAADVFQQNPQLASKLSAKRAIDAAALGVDAVTAPTPLYDPSTTYESGEDPALPAVTMTPFSAQQYTKWLSAVLGRDYRLPSEAEWLHAAAAGQPVEDATPDDLDAVAWTTDNSEFVAHEVGQKTPNAWGLYDTLGNAAELLLDAVYPDGRPDLTGKKVGWADAVAWPREGDARIAKGGWYDAEADQVTLAGRMPTEDSDWKSSDPNLPRSPWWYADYPATGVGFRVVRPLDPIPAALHTKVWDAVDPTVVRAVTERLREGRGKLGPIGEDLPAVLEELRSPAVRKLLK